MSISTDIAPSRQDAILLGLRRYHGEPCKHGHGTARNLSNNACTECNRLYGIAHKAARKDAERERKRAYKAANPDKVRAERARHMARHADALREKAKAYDATNPKRIKAREDAAWRADVKAALQAIKAQRKAEQRAARIAAQLGPEERQHRIAMRNRRRASKRRALRRQPGTVSATALEVAQLLIAQNGCCAYCGASDRAMHNDHKVAVSRGGTDAIENMQWLCAPCNMRKHTTPDDEYRRLQGIPARTPWDAPPTWNL